MNYLGSSHDNDNEMAMTFNVFIGINQPNT